MLYYTCFADEGKWALHDITFNVSVAEMCIYVLVNLSKRRAASSNQYIFYIKSPADTVWDLLHLHMSMHVNTEVCRYGINLNWKSQNAKGQSGFSHCWQGVYSKSKKGDRSLMVVGFTWNHGRWDHAPVTLPLMCLGRGGTKESGGSEGDRSKKSLGPWRGLSVALCVCCYRQMTWLVGQSCASVR